MSELRRYTPAGSGVARTDKDGEYVSYSDYRFLLADFSQMTAWGRGLEYDLSHARVEISFLKSEVQRLRKAGDEVIHEWSSGHGTDIENFTKAVWLWTVAKEGKQGV